MKGKYVKIKIIFDSEGKASTIETEIDCAFEQLAAAKHLINRKIDETLDEAMNDKG